MSEAPHKLEKSADNPGFFPEDLSHRPRPLVFLVGLDLKERDVHKRIFDAFTVHKSTKRPIINYQLVTPTHEYPSRSKHKLTYEGYTPKGIVPAGWIHKHLYDLPSVLVVFYDLDWDTQDFEQKQTECTSRISCLRQSLQGLSTRILLVLIQSRVFITSHSGTAADQTAARRMTGIVQACGIQGDQLFPLPHTERMMDCILKIEISFMDQAMLYYSHRIKTVRAHKDLLSRPTHLSLFVRHQFKIGFLSEIKKDLSGALKHYNHAYNNLLEIQVEDRNALEVKMVAGILNYKICQLTFVDSPRQAISTFRKHIEIFRKHEGPRDLSFQHQHWLAAENSHFARMFADAIDGIQTLNPGMYYVIAAEHAKARRDIVKGFSPTNRPDPFLPPAPRFYGQYSWRDGLLESGETDESLRSAGVAHLCQGEQNVEHNWEVIGLLCRAVNQFKRYSSRRLTASVKVQLAEEYFSAGEHKKILDLLLGTVALLFRGEHWWRLLERVGELCLTCAYLEKSYPFFVMLLLESLSHYSSLGPDTKLRMHESLEKFLRYQPPPPPDRCPSELRETALQQWSGMCEGRELSTVKLDMNQLAGCVECKVSFQKERYQADEVVSLQLHLFSSAPSALPLKEVSIHLSRECYTCTLSPGGEGEGEPIPLLPYSVFSHTFTFLPHTNDVTGSIHADSIHIELGYPGSEHPIVSLTWSLPPVSWGQPCTRVPPGFSKQWSKLQQHYSTDITLRESKVDLYIQTPSPSLVNDLHRLLLILENREEGDISNVSFKLELVRSGGEESPLVTSLVLDPSVSEEMRSSLTDFSFKQDLIRSGDTCTKVVCVRSSSANIQEFHLLVSYEIARDLGKYGVINCSCVKESRTSINIVYPFKVIPTLTSLRCLPLEFSVRTEEQFLLHIETVSTCPWSLLITGSSLKHTSSLELFDPQDSHLQGCTIQHKETVSETFCLQVPSGQSANSNLSLGDYIIRWKRMSFEEDEEFSETSMTFHLPRVHVKDVPFRITTEHPAFGMLYQPIDYHYIIFNKTFYVQEFEAGVDDSADFLFSGRKNHTFNILPRSDYTISYCLCPTTPGNSQLPKFWIRFLREPGPYEGLTGSMVPSHLFIKP